MLLWKRSVFIVLLIIGNQSKIKTIPQTGFETFISNNSRYKAQRFHGGFFELKRLEIFTRAFLLKIIIII